MPSNVTLNAGTGGSELVTKQVTHDGDTAHLQSIGIVGVSGTEDSYTIADINGSAANGLEVDVTQVQGTVTVDGSGVTQPVSGTVTANLGATDNAVLDSIDSAVNGTLTVGSHAVTNAGTFAVQIADTSFAVADGNALGEGVLIQGDDGTDRKNINVDATTGDVQVDVTNTVTVDLGANNDVTVTSGTITAVTDITNTIDSTISGDALTALQLIDDAVHTDDAAFTLGTGKGVMAMGYAGTQSVNSGDAAALACDTDGALHISDGGNSITVDGTVTANPASGTIDTVTTVTAVTDITNTIDSTISGAALTALQVLDNCVFADDAVFTLGSSSVTMAGAVRDDALSTLTAIEGDAVPLRVNSTGALHVTGGGGGTEYNVDDAGPTVVTMAGAVRDDSLTTLTEADGDATLLRVSSTGALHVTGGGGGTEYTEDSATPATITGTASLMERDDALATLTPIEGDWVGMRATAEGALWTQDFNSDAMAADLATLAGAVSTEVQVDVVGALPAGTNAIGKLAANSGVDIGDVDVLSVVPGTGATNLGKAEDAAHTSGDAGVMALAVSAALATARAGTAGDYQPLSVSSSNGRLFTDAVGDYAHDAADSGNPLKIGGKAYNFDGTAPQTAVAEADRVNGIFTPEGRQYVETSHPNYWRAHNQDTAAQTNITVKAAPGAGLKLYLTDVIVSNGATAGNIKLLDGSGGTVLLELYPAVNGGLTHSFRTPIALTANTLLAITSTTVTTHTVTVTGFIAA